MKFKLRKPKTITIINPTESVINRFVEEGIESFQIDKVDDLTSLTLKNDRKTRKILKNLQLNEEE